MPVDPQTGKIPSEPAAQVELTMQHCLNILAAAGGKPSDVTLTFVYLTDLSIKPLVNEAFRRHFGSKGPARNLVEVSDIGLDAIVEMSLIACVVTPT
jgi:enamine deaminase RidA (YjgF/YER057c/UK114 family)